MRCQRCGSKDLATLADFGQGTSRRFWVGCGECGHVFRAPQDPEGTLADQHPTSNVRHSTSNNERTPGEVPVAPTALVELGSLVASVDGDPNDEVGARIAAAIEANRREAEALLALYQALNRRREAVGVGQN